MNRPSILMIDPSPESVELARFSVWRSKLDCSFGWFEDGEQAAQSLFSPLAAQQPDALPALILLESHLPRMDGTELLHLLRHHEHTRRVPVVIFSTSYDEGEERRTLRAGADRYVVKPVDAREFMDTVVTLVSYWLGRQRSA